MIEINGVRSEGAIRTAEGSRETLLVGPASPEPTRGLCLIRPVNLRDRGHRHTLIRPDGSSVAGQMSAIFILFLHLSNPPPTHRCNHRALFSPATPHLSS